MSIFNLEVGDLLFMRHALKAVADNFDMTMVAFVVGISIFHKMWLVLSSVSVATKILRGLQRNLAKVRWPRRV